MDVRLTDEQRELRDAAAKLVNDLGPASVADLDDAERVARLEKTVGATGWRWLRSDGASGVEVAIVAEEFGRGLVDVPYLGPVLADEIQRHVAPDAPPATIVLDGTAPDARGISRGVSVSGGALFASELSEATSGVDLTRFRAATLGEPEELGRVSSDHHDAWHALALVASSADMLGGCPRSAELGHGLREGAPAIRQDDRVLPGRRAHARRESRADRGIDQRAVVRRVGGRRTVTCRGGRRRSNREALLRARRKDGVRDIDSSARWHR